MRRFLLSLLLTLIPTLAWAACVPQGATPSEMGCQPQADGMGPNDSFQVWQPDDYPKAAKQLPASKLFQGQLQATNFGVKADATYTLTAGVPVVTGTSNDVAMKAAVDACAAIGATLLLPPGMILMTGAATVNLRNCHLVGTGVLQGLLNEPGSYGTMFLLTSTTVKPFTITHDFGITGINFFWPNQITGTTVYPPLMSPPTPTGGTAGWYMEDSVIINAYDGILAAGGSFRVHDCWIYAVNDAFRISGIGDSFYVSHVHFTPGPWFTMTAFGATTAIDTVTQKNTIFHFASNGATGGVNNAINFSVDNIGAFAWRYGVKVDAPMQVGLSNWEGIFDGVQTIVDTATGGGSWAQANRPITGLSNCSHVTYGTKPGTGVVNAPCFNMGTNDSLNIDGWRGASAGTFVELNGASVEINNTSVTIGGIVDGGNYYVVHAKANPGGTNIHVMNSSFSGTQNTVADPAGISNSHGIKGDVLIPRVTIQNNGFIYFRDAIDYIPGPSSIITGNWIDATAATSTESIKSASLAASNFPTIYLSNKVDKPPVSVAGACGKGCTATGSFAGQITVGSDIPISAGTLTVPWVQGIAVCYFWGNGLLTPIQATLAPGSLRQWNWTSQGAVDVHGKSIFYACPAQN